MGNIKMLEENIKDMKQTLSLISFSSYSAKILHKELASCEKLLAQIKP